jgi:hypothetical protein
MNRSAVLEAAIQHLPLNEVLELAAALPGSEPAPDTVPDPSLAPTILSAKGFVDPVPVTVRSI